MNFGRIFCTRGFLDSESAGAVFAKMEFVPYGVRRDDINNEYQLKGRSPLFSPVLEGEQIPFYRLEITAHENGTVLGVKVEKQA